MVLQLFRFRAARRPALWRQPPTDAAAVRRRLQRTVSRCAMQCSPRTASRARTGRSEPRQAETALVTGEVSRCTVWDPIPTDGMVSRNSMQSGGSASDLGGTRADPEPVPPCCNIPLHAATYYSMLHRTRLEDLRQTAPARWQHESARSCTGKRRKPSGARDGRSQSQAPMHDGLAWPVAL